MLLILTASSSRVWFRSSFDSAPRPILFSGFSTTPSPAGPCRILRRRIFPLRRPTDIVALRCPLRRLLRFINRSFFSHRLFCKKLRSFPRVYLSSRFKMDTLGKCPFSTIAIMFANFFLWVFPPSPPPPPPPHSSDVTSSSAAHPPFLGLILKFLRRRTKRRLCPPSFTGIGAVVMS